MMDLCIICRIENGIRIQGLEQLKLNNKHKSIFLNLKTCILHCILYNIFNASSQI